MNPMSQISAEDWRAKAAEFSVDRRPRCAGQSIEVPDGRALVRIDPASGRQLGEYHAASGQTVDQVVSAARQSADQGHWSGLPPMARRSLMLELADRVDAQAVELALADSLDVGKPVSAAEFEAHIAASCIRFFAESIDKGHNGQTVPTEVGSLEMHVRRPRGVVAAIIPWNYPVINAALKIAPALAAGNCVVAKPSELSPSSALLLSDLACEAGLPPGALSVLPGDGVTGSDLVRHPGVDMIAFTGSTATGRAIMSDVADSALRPLQLECGGKSPEVVFADVAALGLEGLAANIVGGAFANQGQLCVARSRLIVEESIHDELLSVIQAQLENMTPGDPLDPSTTYGPLASPAQKRRVEDYIAQGEQSGAELLLDGRSPAGYEQGCYVGPTLFSQVDPASSIAREEIFGPVLSVFSFKDEEEALALANDSEYGLAATIWTRDMARGQRMAGAIQAGKTSVRTGLQMRMGAGWAHESEPCRQSGFGVEGGVRGMETYTRLQSVDFSWD